MVKKTYILLICLVLFTSCFRYYYIKKDKNGEPIISKESYTLNSKMTKDDLKVIDTTSYYLELLDGFSVKDNNPSILKFHNDGTFEIKSKKYFNNFEQSRSKESVFYGGRFVLNKNDLKIERFYPSTGSTTNYYEKKISKGVVKNDTITLNVFNNNRIYVKKSYVEIFE